MDALALSLSSALSGLQAAQQNLSVISGNISNANTAGYSRETLPTTALLIPGSGGVATGVAQRNVDQTLNANLRTQISATSAASTLDSYYQSIQNLFGTVSGANSLSNTLSSFTSALQSLSTTPSDTVAQQNVVSAGQALTNQLNSMSSGIQTLRANADSGISDAVAQVNTLLQSIVSYNSQIAKARATNQSTAALEDQRDQALQQLAQQMPIQAYTDANDNMVVATPQGTTLVAGTAAQLTFTPAGTVTAASTLSQITVNGLDITSQISGGSIGALLQMRDQVLPNLTGELNQFTNQLYNTSQVATAQTQTMVGTPAVGDVLTGTIDGVNFTTAGLTTGNANAAGIASAIQTAIGSVLPNVTVTATGTNTIEIIDSAGNTISSTIKLSSGTGSETFTPGGQTSPTSSVQATSTQTQTMSGTPAAGDILTGTVEGVQFTTAGITSGTTTAIAAAIQAKVGAGIKVTAPTATTIQFTDMNGNPLSSTISFSSGTGTETFVASSPSNPLTTTDTGLSGSAPGDAYHFFAYVNTASGVDNAATIEVNPSLVSNPSLLDGTSAAPSPGIAGALAAALGQSTPTFAAAGNFPTSQTLTLNQYAGQIIGQAATAASTASDNSQYQTGVQQQLSTAVQSVSGVNMDQELANLTVYQTAYAASARVLQTVNNMFTALFQA